MAEKVKEKKKHKGLKVLGVIILIIALIVGIGFGVIYYLTKPVDDTSDKAINVGGMLTSQSIDYKEASADGLENDLIVKIMQVSWKFCDKSDKKRTATQTPPENVVNVKDIPYIDDGNHLDCLNHAVFRHCGNYQLVAQNVRVYRFVVTRIDNQFFRADNIRQQRTCLNADGMSLVNAAAAVSVNFLYQQRTEADSQKLNSGTYPEQRQSEFLGIAYHFLICLCPVVDAVVALKLAVPAIRGSECAAGKQNCIRFQH